MEFSNSSKAQDYLNRLRIFMEQSIFPAEAIYHQQRRDLQKSGRPHDLPAIVEELKESAHLLRPRVENSLHYKLM